MMKNLKCRYNYTVQNDVYIFSNLFFSNLISPYYLLEKYVGVDNIIHL